MLWHQPGTGRYHYHASPQCLRLDLGDNIQVDRDTRTGPVCGEKSAPWTHSPIMGWASDGNPVYGPYGYTDPTSATRTSLPSWSLGQHSGVSQTLTSAQHGPEVNAKLPLGRCVEDYERVSSVGDLDQYNGRFTVTPEFPNGTYAYYATVDDSGNPAFPYLLAGEFYGAVSGGFNSTVASAATDYFNAGTVTAGPTAPPITAWSTKNWNKPATTISRFDSSAGSVTTWLFLTNRFGLAAATVTRVRNGVTSQEEIYSVSGGSVVAAPIALGTDQVYLRCTAAGSAPPPLRQRRLVACRRRSFMRARRAPTTGSTNSTS